MTGARRPSRPAGASNATAKPAAVREGLVEGTVTAAHGRHYLVTPDAGGSPWQCFPRGKKSEIAVGDRVVFEPRSTDQGVIVEVAPRRNLFHRSDAFREKLFAANIDRLAIIVATVPHFSDDLLGRSMVAAEAQDVTPLIVLNKTDVEESLPATRERLAPYRALGYDICEVSAAAQPQQALATLGERLADHVTLLIGQSGMGKSTLVNLLIPGADVTTREISVALNSGRHTTTFTRLYALPGGGALIDSPGFQEFGLHHLSEGMLERAFPEFRPLLGGCRFYNCRHLHEPGCAILEAVAEGRIQPSRHALYAQLVHEAAQILR